MYWFVTVTTSPSWDCAPAPYGSATSTRIKIAAGKKTPLIECARAAAMLILIVLRRARRKRMMTKKNEPLTGSHPLLPNLDQEIIEEMLLRIGASSVEELFSDIPSDIRLKRGLRLPEGQSESVVRRDLQSRLASNKTPPSSLCFLGGGVWPHYIPAAVESVVSRQEFYTSYTPYQPEISQGMLQALFEYQSLMGDLLRMEACNSSMYDWPSAAGEATPMAPKGTGRRRFPLFGGPHLGIFAVRDLRLARSMPGRLIGMTTEKDSEQKAFSMVLQTREQHIRREGATSNICTNQSLMAVAASCYLAMLGKTGLRRLGEVIISNSHYAAKRLSGVAGVTSPLFKGPR